MTLALAEQSAALKHNGTESTTRMADPCLAISLIASTTRSKGLFFLRADERRKLEVPYPARLVIEKCGRVACSHGTWCNAWWQIETTVSPILQEPQKENAVLGTP